MLTVNLISETLPVMHPSDTGQQALGLMDVFRVSHLPVVRDKAYLGLLSDKLIYDLHLPEEPIELLYFNDLPSLLGHLTPKRFELLAELRKVGHVSINALAKHLHRQYRNVYNDVKVMERLGLVEKDTAGLYFVPWDVIDATFRLVA